MDNHAWAWIVDQIGGYSRAGGDRRLMRTVTPIQARRRADRRPGAGV
jgi:hypothetical protein